MHKPVLRRILFPFAAALPLIALMAGTALANPPLSQVTVYNEDGTAAGATVCEFYMVFGTVAGGESGVWEIQTRSGSVVRSGDYSVTASQPDREPNAGDISLPDGTYVLRWDNEAAIDVSQGQLDITVACAVTSPSPSPTVAPSGSPSVAPSPSAEASQTPPSPSPSEITTGGGDNGPSASPTGEVQGITVTQPTPPPTDTATSGGSSAPTLAVVLLLLATCAAIAATLPAARVAIRRR